MDSTQWQIECIEPRVQAECMKGYDELVQKLIESFCIPKDILSGVDGHYSSHLATMQQYASINESSRDRMKLP